MNYLKYLIKILISPELLIQPDTPFKILFVIFALRNNVKKTENEKL